VAKRGDLKPVMKTCIGFDELLAQKIRQSAQQNERGWNQEVRYALRQFYGITPIPAEAPTDVSA
jgi:hypothetical protein